MTSNLSPSSRVAQRDTSLDTLRAIACIALVSYHMVGGSPAEGMEVPPDHWLALLNGTFIDMRMPLFSFLSGCVFVSLEGLTRSLGQMVLSKMRRLLLPMLSVGVLFWLVGTAIGQAQPPLVSLLYMPYAHFWFLQATFVIMASFLLLQSVWPGRSTALAMGLMGLAALIWVSGLRATPGLFSVNQVAYLMPFFMLGYLCAHGTVLTRLKASIPPALAVLALLGLVGLGFALVSGFLRTPSEAARAALTLMIGAIFCLSLLIVAPRHSGLARLGGYSYTIYLFHVFFTAGSFEALRALAPGTPDALVWAIGLVAGIAGPVAAHHVLLRSRILSTLFLGMKPRPRSAASRPVAHIAAPQRA